MSGRRVALVGALAAGLAALATLATWTVLALLTDSPDASRTTLARDAHRPVAPTASDRGAPLAPPPAASVPPAAHAGAPPPSPTPARTAVAPSEKRGGQLDAVSDDDERAARVAGVVLDVDGAPAAGVTLTLRASLLALARADEPEFLRERLETDANGRFETGEPFPAGRVSVRARRGGERLDVADDRHDHLAHGPPCGWTLRILGDVTFRVHIDGSDDDGPSGWRGRIVHLDDDGRERDWRWRFLDEERGAHVLRYRRSTVEPGPHLRPRIEVESTDAVWRGTAPVAAAAPRAPLDVEVAVARIHALLAGSVVTADGVPIPHADVSCTPLAGDEEPRRTRMQPWSSGAFTFERLAPGPYLVAATLEVGTLEVGTFGDDTLGDGAHCERRVDAALGRNALEPLVLDALVGRVAGTVRCANGVDTPPGTVRLRRVGAERDEERTTRIGSDGSFHFGGPLRRGAYELSIEPGVPGAFAPAARTVFLPADAIAILLAGCASSGESSVRPVDGETGEPIRGSVVVVAATDALWHAHSERVFRHRALDLPVDGAARWTLRVDGYRPVSVAAGALAGPDVAALPLEPGWGALVRLRRAGSCSETSAGVVRTPPTAALAGLALHADGAPVATTDPTGTALVSLDERPASLTVPRWRVVSTEDALAAVERGAVLELEPAASEER